MTTSHHNDTLYKRLFVTLGINDIQPNDTHNNGLICDTQHNKTVIMLSAIYGERHKALYA